MVVHFFITLVRRVIDAMMQDGKGANKQPYSHVWIPLIEVYCQTQLMLVVHKGM